MCNFFHAYRDGRWRAGPCRPTAVSVQLAAVSCAGTRLCMSAAHAALEQATDSDSETEAETRNLNAASLQ